MTFTRLAIFIGCLVAPIGAHAEEPWPYPDDIPVATPADPGLAGAQPPNIVRLLKVRGIVEPDLSPDGKNLAFQMSTTGKPQLWVVDAKGGWPRQLTFGNAVYSHQWAPSSTDLLYGADTEGDERINLKYITQDGRTENIIRPANEAFVVPGEFSDDARYLAYASTERNGRDFDIRVVDLETKADKQVFEGRFGFFPGDWRPGQEQIIVSETRGEDGNDLHLLDVSSGTLTTLFKPDITSLYGSVTWKPDGSGFYLVTNQDREYQALAVYDLETKQLEILDAPEHDVEGLSLVGKGRYLIWSVNEGGFSTLKARDLETGKPVTPPADLPPGVYNLDGAKEASAVAIRVNGPRTPWDAYVWNLDDGSLSHSARSDLVGLDPARFVVPESLNFEARDGVRLNGLFYAAKTEDGALPPVVVTVHGGPTAQARPRFSPLIQYLVAHGIAVFDLNFRGSTGFGKTFARLDNQFKRTDAVRDVADAVAWLKTTKRVDTTKAAVMGGSYGGYLTNAVIGMYPDTFVAGVSFVGVSDWVRALETASPQLKASDRIEYGDISDPKVREYHASISPINFVDDIKASVLVVHGANDPRDPVAESDAFVKAIRERGGEAVYLRFPDEGHGIRKLENRITANRRVVEFLKAALR